MSQSSDMVVDVDQWTHDDFVQRWPQILPLLVVSLTHINIPWTDIIE